LLLWDFDYATIKQLNIDNEKINTEFSRKFGVCKDENPSYDCQMILNWIITWTLKLYKYEHVHEEDKLTENMKFGRDLLYSMVPGKYRGERNTILKHGRFRNGQRIVQHFIPRNILENNEWMRGFQTPPSGTEGMDWIIIERYNCAE
jgi:hypothetical protein